jgi:hypothetical protein
MRRVIEGKDASEELRRRLMNSVTRPFIELRTPVSEKFAVMADSHKAPRGAFR